MTQLEKLRMLLATEILDDNISDDFLELLLERSESAIMDKRYPFVDWTEEDDDGNRVYPLESRYYGLQLEIAVVLYNKMGWEGEASHSENGVSRTGQSGGDIPNELLNRVTPFAKVG